MNFILIKDQRGIALITAILMLVVLSVLGIIAVNVTTIGAKITGNTRTSRQAFYMAEAGIDNAREVLRKHIAENWASYPENQRLSKELDLYKRGDGTLPDSSNVANFLPTDLPFINSTTMGNGSYKVYLTNDNSSDGIDIVTSTTDTNFHVTLTSFGYGPDNSRAIIQVTVLRVPIPNLPGAICLPGPNVNFFPSDSNAVTVEGDAYPAIAVNYSSSETEVREALLGPPDRSSKYTGEGGTPSVVTKTFPDPWGDLNKLQTLYQNLKNIADFNDISQSGFTLGSTSDPKLVVIDNDFTVPGGTVGAGILLVTGELIFEGNFDYDGMILVVGRGSIRRSGAGNGVINGGVYVANIEGPDESINATSDNTWGPPTWDTRGGGNSDIVKSAVLENTQLQKLPFVITSWKQIYQ
jgi:Tfp pilus assembly protein PilX